LFKLNKILPSTTTYVVSKLNLVVEEEEKVRTRFCVALGWRKMKLQK
jgi:hypothetical protein